MNSTQFRTTYYPYHQKLYRIAYRMLLDVQLAEDVVQETFLKLWDSRDKLQHVETPEAYAIKTVQNMTLTHIRNKKSKQTLQYDYEIADPESPIAQVEHEDGALRLRALINNLPEQQRQAMLLRHCDGYTYEEIGTEMNLEVKHLRVIVSRARKTLREQYAKIEKI